MFWLLRFLGIPYMLSSEHVLTCAHVVDNARGADGRVRVRIKGHVTTATSTTVTSAQGSTAALDALAQRAAPVLTSKIESLGDKLTAPLDKLPGALETQAKSWLGTPGDKVGDEVGKLNPALTAQASSRSAATKGGETRTVNLTRSGPAHQFVYDSKVVVKIHPWAHDGYYKNAVKSLLWSDDERSDVAKGVWQSEERVIPDADRVTLDAKDYQASHLLDGEDQQPASPLVRSQDSWNGLPDDSILIVKPFSASKELHSSLDALINRRLLPIPSREPTSAAPATGR